MAFSCSLDAANRVVASRSHSLLSGQALANRRFLAAILLLPRGDWFAHTESLRSSETRSQRQFLSERKALHAVELFAKTIPILEKAIPRGGDLID
jgi:hypothetical protein